MPDQPNFPIPADLTPDTFCLCLQIPNDPTWISNFVGLLAQPTYWFNWQRDSARSGKVLAQYWTKLFDDIDWSTMSCCCDQPPAIFRYNDDGVYQMSTDGGTTWVDAPQFDYRNTSIIFPPPSALGIDTTKCQNADSAVFVINTEIVQALNETFAAAQILALIAAVLLAVLSAGSLLAFTPLITAIGAAILDVGVAATQAAFTTAVLDRLRCRIFNNMDSDTSIDSAGLAAILASTNSQETGIVQTVLYGIINAAGVDGITNMIRSNKGDPDADCSACTSTCSVDLWSVEIFDGEAIGSIIDVGINYITVQSVAHHSFGGSIGQISIWTGDADLCCLIDHLTFLTGETEADMHIFDVECGNEPWPPGTRITWDGVNESNTFQIQKISGASTQFQVKIFFA